MITINLFDTTFKHLRKKNGKYSMVKDKIPKHIRYVHDKMNFDGITIFTDTYLNSPIVKKVKSKYKIGWIIEPPEITSNTYSNFENYKDNFDFILTYNIQLLQRYPNRTKFVPFGGTWVDESEYKMYGKNKEINIIYSNKKFARGHKLRHQVANSHNELDKFGLGPGKPFDKVKKVLAPYKYSIVIENDKIRNFFTEKLLNCFAVGTIPIYWGCPNIGDFFNTDGIVQFHTTKELDRALEKIKFDSDNFFSSMKAAVQDNFNRVKKYDVVENWMYENIFKNL